VSSNLSAWCHEQTSKGYDQGYGGMMATYPGSLIAEKHEKDRRFQCRRLLMRVENFWEPLRAWISQTIPPL